MSVSVGAVIEILSVAYNRLNVLSEIAQTQVLYVIYTCVEFWTKHSRFVFVDFFVLILSTTRPLK